MDRVIVICIFGVLAIMLVSKVLKGGLGFLRIALMALLFVLLLGLIARPSDSPGLLPSLAKRIFSENSVPIAAEASGEVLTNEGSSGGGGTSSVDSGISRPFSTQATLPSSSITRSAEAAFSGSTTTASSNQIQASSPPSTFSTQSTTLDTSQSGASPPSSASSEVQSPSSTRYTPPSSASRPINALW